jgi:uncharacterized protein YndB with AHSA1/START domain
MNAIPNPVADDTTLELRRVFAAPPAAVFDAWLIQEQFAAWIGPEGVQCAVPVLEPHVGGRYEITMRLSNGQVIPVAGTFRCIERPNRLVFTWGWNGDPSRQSLVTLEFHAHADQTELVLRHEGLGTVSDRDGHGRGWKGTLNKLERHLVTV